MKSNIKRLAVLFAALLILFSVVSCAESGGNDAQTSGDAGTTEAPLTNADGSAVTTEAPSLPAIWNDATHKEDKTFGDGEKTFTLKVVADGHTVTFTVKTNVEFVGTALLANGLITGEEGPYGLYVKAVNGMIADYDIDQTYWAISKGGEYLMTGVATTPVENGATYELTRTKG